MEPHTHTKRHAGNFLWSWQAEWLAGACAVHTYVRTSHFMTFLHEANFHPAYCQWHGKLDVSFAFFFLTFHVNRSIYLLLNFNLNDILRNICQKSRDEGEEKGIENNNGKE